MIRPRKSFLGQFVMCASMQHIYPTSAGLCSATRGQYTVSYNKEEHSRQYSLAVLNIFNTSRIFHDQLYLFKETNLSQRRQIYTALRRYFGH